MQDAVAVQLVNRTGDSLDQGDSGGGIGELL